MRSALPGELRAADVGREVSLAGWVARRRDHGNLIFVDLRDRSGLVQLVFDPGVAPEAHHFAEALRSEYVVRASGLVVARAPETVNQSPYDHGWMLKLKVTNPDEADALLSADDYAKLLG